MQAIFQRSGRRDEAGKRGQKTPFLRKDRSNGAVELRSLRRHASDLHVKAAAVKM